MKQKRIRRQDYGTVGIKPFLNPSGEQVWRVVGVVNGERRRKNVKTDAEALALKQAWEREIASLPPVPMVTTRLSDPQIREAEACFHRLAASGMAMTFAVDYALLNYKASAKQATVKKALDLFMAARKKQNLRPDSLTNLRVRCARLPQDKLVNELTADDVRAVVERGTPGPVTRNNNRRAVRAFLTWCVQEKFAATNVADAIEVVEVDDKEPQILTLSQVRALLAAAQSYLNGVCYPYVVLGLFAGLRPTELKRLSAQNWEPFKFGEPQPFIKISGEIAKMRGRRNVDLMPNAVVMLKEAHLARQLIVKSKWRFPIQFRNVRRLAGIPNWVPDIMRHTAISMHYEQFKHEGKTAQWAGNSPDMIHKHYKGLVTAGDAELFWKIGLPVAKPIALTPAEAAADDEQEFIGGGA